VRDPRDETIFRDTRGDAGGAVPDLDAVADVAAEDLRPQVRRGGLRVDGQGLEAVLAALGDVQHPLRPVQGVGVVLQDQVGAAVRPREQVLRDRRRVLDFLQAAAAGAGGLDVVGDGGVVAGAGDRGDGQFLRHPGTVQRVEDRAEHRHPVVTGTGDHVGEHEVGGPAVEQQDVGVGFARRAAGGHE